MWWPICAGEQPALTPRKLTLMNTTIQSVIQDISFQTSILAVRLNRKRYFNFSVCLGSDAIRWLGHFCKLAEDKRQCIANMPADPERFP